MSTCRRQHSRLADSRGFTLVELMVVLVNLGQEPFAIRRGDRVAQLVPAPVLRAQFSETDDLDETARGMGGFGSTGR